MLGRVFKVVDSLLHDRVAVLTKLLNYLTVALTFKLFELLFDYVHCFFFHLVASEIGHHFALAWQIQLFLVPNDAPCLIYKNW